MAMNRTVSNGEVSLAGVLFEELNIKEEKQHDTVNGFSDVQEWIARIHTYENSARCLLRSMKIPDITDKDYIRYCLEFRLQIRDLTQISESFLRKFRLQWNLDRDGTNPDATLSLEWYIALIALQREQIALTETRSAAIAVGNMLSPELFAHMRVSDKNLEKFRAQANELYPDPQN